MTANGSPHENQHAMNRLEESSAKELAGNGRWEWE